MKSHKQLDFQKVEYEEKIRFLKINYRYNESDIIKKMNLKRLENIQMMQKLFVLYLTYIKELIIKRNFYIRKINKRRKAMKKEYRDQISLTTVSILSIISTFVLSPFYPVLSSVKNIVLLVGIALIIYDYFKYSMDSVVQDNKKILSEYRFGSNKTMKKYPEIINIKNLIQNNKEEIQELRQVLSGEIEPWIPELKKLERELELIKKGIIGENMVFDCLKKNLSDNYVILNDVTIPTKSGKTTQIDHIVIGKENIYVLETKNIKGRFYPNGYHWTWFPWETQYKVKPTTIDSPQKQNLYHYKKLKDILDMQNIDISLKPIVILTNKESEWKGDAYNDDCPVLFIDKLISFIQNNENKQYIKESTQEDLGNALIKLSNKYENKHYEQFRK